MAGAVKAKSRVEEVAALLAVMKASGVTTLKVGDIELTLAPPAAHVFEEDEKPKYVSREQAEAEARAHRRSMMLASGSRIVSRVGE